MSDFKQFQKRQLKVHAKAAAEQDLIDNADIEEAYDIFESFEHFGPFWGLVDAVLESAKSGLPRPLWVKLFGFWAVFLPMGFGWWAMAAGLSSWARVGTFGTVVFWVLTFFPGALIGAYFWQWVGFGPRNVVQWMVAMVTVAALFGGCGFTCSKIVG